jgi:hypothetical protein
MRARHRDLDPKQYSSLEPTKANRLAEAHRPAERRAPNPLPPVA